MKRKGIVIQFFYKMGYMLLVLIMCMSLAACGEEKTTAEYSAEEEEAIEEDASDLGDEDVSEIGRPSPNDPLTESCTMPNTSPPLVIKYPATMTAIEDEGSDSYVEFVPANVVEGVSENPEDAYSAISMMLVQVGNAYDGLMDKGSEQARKGMEKLLNDSVNSAFGDKIVKGMGHDFVNGGTYYRITGYYWFDGKILGKDGPGHPIRGTCDMRYMGPNGYIFLTMVVSEGESIRNYYDISCKMADTVKFGAEWSTAPKSVPQKPGTPAKKSASSSSNSGDTGDYGTAYYWFVMATAGIITSATTARLITGTTVPETFGTGTVMIIIS